MLLTIWTQLYFKREAYSNLSLRTTIYIVQNTKYNIDKNKSNKTR